MKLPTSPTIITIVSFVVVVFVSFCFGFEYRSSQIGTYTQTPVRQLVYVTSAPTPSPFSSSPLKTDDRSCFSGEVKNTFDVQFFVGKTFMNMSASGEWGTLKSNHQLPVGWGLDYAGPNDTRPNSGVGIWSVKTRENGIELTFLKTSLSDGSYTNFKFYKYKQNIFAVPLEYSGLIVGPGKNTIQDFFDNVIKPCWSQTY